MGMETRFEAKERGGRTKGRVGLISLLFFTSTFYPLPRQEN